MIFFGMRLLVIFLFLLEYLCVLYHYDWVVANTPMNPDGSGIFEVPTVNGQIPGPEIRVPYGSNLEIKVTNHLSHGLTIHWHGLTQKRSLKADGVPYVTQDPILPGCNYTYKFSTGDQVGTFWYHAHTALDGATVFGAFIITNPKEVYSYDEELLLMLSDYWHKDLYRAALDLIQEPFHAVRNPDSVLINGLTSYNTSNDRFTELSVKPNTRYRLRIIGSHDFSFYRLRIQHHKMTVIEADGTLIEPITVDYLDVSAGTRYSVILETGSEKLISWITCQNINEGEGASFGFAKLRYKGAHSSDMTPLSDLSFNKTTVGDSTFEDQLLTSRYLRVPSYYPVPRKYDQELVFNVTVGVVNVIPVFRINKVIHQQRTETVLTKIRSQPNYVEPGLYKIRANGKGKQFIFQQFFNNETGCMPHPWHLHGHSFYVVGRGSGIYDPNRDKIPINPDKLPILRDTFTFYPQNTTDSPARGGGPASCGWYAIRFIADNPGLWLMHCHIAAHMIMGKQVLVHSQ